MTASILTRIHMKTCSAGGRCATFTEDYCPDFVVSGQGERLQVRAIQCPGPVAPGEEAEVIFALMYHPQRDYGILQVGVAFDVMEGLRVIATGQVLEVHT
jgi:hypothetical protein